MALSAADAMTLQTGVWRADTEVTAGIHTPHIILSKYYLLYKVDMQDA